MKIEILFPEFCNLYGDLMNMDYLKKCLPNAEFIETALADEPLFFTQDISMVYLGPATERTQEKIIKKFMLYKDRIKQLIENGTVFLFTGNSLEIMGKYIENEDGTRIDALGIFDTYAKRDLMHRHNSVYMGEFEDTKILGFKTQFTFSYPQNDSFAFIKNIKGVGMNPKCGFEGIHYKNFYGTYLVDPILIMNPQFTKKILDILGDGTLAFETEVNIAYEKRLKDYIDKVKDKG